MPQPANMSFTRTIATTLFVLALAWPGLLTANDGPSREPASLNHPVEAQEILPTGVIAPAESIKLTTGSNVFSEGFEGSFPGSTWQLYHPSGAPDVDWGKTSYRKSAGSYSIWCGASGSASPGSGNPVPTNMQSWVIAGPFDLSGATSGEISFDLWLSTEASYDYFKWLASTNGQNFSGFQTSADTSGFQTATTDLADWGSAGNLLGQSQVWIAFIYESDSSNAYEGAYVDQVAITINGGGGGSNCGTYVLTDDNDNNSWGGTPDGDWNRCLYKTDSAHPIEFHIDVSESSVSSAQLLLLCNDVDQYTEPNNPEIDKVYVNGTYLGDLTGANDEDSTTIFTVPTSAISPGRNRFRIDVNQSPTSSPDDWCVTLKQAQLIINGGCTGQASCRSVSTNRSSYAPGETVRVTYEIDTTAPSQQIRVESNLVNPNGVIVAGAERNYTTNGSSNDPRNVDLTLPTNAMPGTYTAQVLVFDSASGQLETTCEDTFTVTGGGSSCSLTCSANVPATAQVGQQVTLTGTANASGCNGSIDYFWYPDAGNTATIFDRTATWIYDAPGTYTWTFVALVDNERCERTGTITITGGGGGTCNINCNATFPATAQVGQTISFSGSASTSGSCGTVEYFWYPEEGYSTATSFGRNGTWSYGQPGVYTWSMYVIGDNGGRCVRTGTINVTGGGTGGINTGVVWIPVGSRATGANGSIWRTDIGIFNPTTVTVTVTIQVWVSTGPIVRTISIVPFGQRIITDVIGWFDPSLWISAPIQIIAPQTLIFTSRTYNVLAAGEICFPTGTLGQVLLGRQNNGTLAIGQSAWIPQLVENGAFRSNIGYTNTGTTTATLTVRLYNANGNQVGSYNVTLAPGQWKQKSRPFNAIAGLANLSAGSARVTITGGSGVVVYGSLIDNITNDPTTIPFYR